MKYKAFIFDLDGVLTDTAEYHYLAWQRMADEEGLPFSRKENEKLRGVSRRASLELLLKGKKLPESRIQELMERKNRYYRHYISEMSPRDLLTGATDILEELLSRGFKLALASASKNAPTVVYRLGIESYFETIADGHSVDKAKPAPDLFLFAASKLAVLPSECVVVEDAAAGVEAAKAAGMTAIGIGPPERVGTADLVYRSVAEIDIDEMLAGLPS